jgi:hypothetical protein
MSSTLTSAWACASVTTSPASFFDGDQDLDRRDRIDTEILEQSD